jgi:hypothetical protein
LLPRKLKLRLETPAAGDLHSGAGALDLPRRLDEVDGVARVLLDPGRHGEDVRVEDDVLGREAHLLGQDAVGPLADGDLAVLAVRLALLVEGHDHHAAPYIRQRRALSTKSSSPSLREMEFTMALPWTHLRPASRPTTSRSRS